MPHSVLFWRSHSTVRLMTSVDEWCPRKGQLSRGKHRQSGQIYILRQPIHELCSKCIMLFMHNNRYLPFYWFTYFVAVNYTACTHSPSWNFWNISEMFPEIFHEIFHAKNFMKVCITMYDSEICCALRVTHVCQRRVGHGPDSSMSRVGSDRLGQSGRQLQYVTLI